MNELYQYLPGFVARQDFPSRAGAVLFGAFILLQLLLTAFAMTQAVRAVSWKPNFPREQAPTWLPVLTVLAAVGLLGVDHVRTI